MAVNRKLSVLVSALVLAAVGMQAQAQDAKFEVSSNVAASLQARTQGQSTLDTTFSLPYMLLSDSFGTDSTNVVFDTNNAGVGIEVQMLTTNPSIQGVAHGQVLPLVVTFAGKPIVAGTKVDITKDEAKWVGKDGLPVPAGKGTTQSSHVLSVTTAASTNPQGVAADNYVGNFDMAFNQGM
jgi:hypothetical protein